MYLQADTVIQYLGSAYDNELYVKREDLIPLSFGGNKARKAFYFFEDLKKQNCDCVVTYGSSSSNHCRVVSNLAASMGMDCHIISPEEASVPTFNSCMMKLFGAEITVCPVSQVHDTIEKKLEDLKKQGKNPYFILGGGHGNLGTQAYVDCYEEITAWENRKNLHFDYIFHASGTGTTQAGLICGQLLHGDSRKIVGISIARKNPRGRAVVLESVRDYVNIKGQAASEEQISALTEFDDSYTGDGYGTASREIQDTIHQWLIRYGIPLDATYTGKAACGMGKYLKEHGIKGKKVLFVHTGGTPLFFDFLKERREES